MQLNIRQIDQIANALNHFIVQLPNEKNLDLLEASEAYDQILTQYNERFQSLIKEHGIEVKDEKIIAGNEEEFGKALKAELAKEYEATEQFLSMDEFKMVCPTGVDLATLKLLKKVLVIK